MPSTHRFQSRLFQTLQSKFYQLQDTVQLRWRQLKVATVWGAQLSLYPLQVAFQATRWSGRVFKQQVAKGAQSLSVALGLREAVVIDQPIRNVLAALDIQTLPVLNQAAQDLKSSALSAQEERRQVFLWPANTQKLSFVEKCGKLWQRWRGRSQKNSAIAPLASPLQGDLVQTPSAKLSPVTIAQTVSIQGVASSLVHRQLVLVASGNQILDILTAEQQQQLHQRIIFEIAVALNMHRRLGASSPSLPSQIAPLALLKAVWKQIQQSGRSVFLPPSAARMLGSETSASPYLTEQTAIEQFAMKQFAMKQFAMNQLAPRLKSLRGAIVAAIGAVALAPFTLALPAMATMAPVLPQPRPAFPFALEWIADPVRTRKQWLKGAALSRQSQPIQGKIRLVPEKAPAALSSEPFQAAITDWAYRFSQTVPSSGRPPIDVDAAFMGYELHPLQRLLLVLDRIMVWLEAQLLWLWQRGELITQRLFL
jgi:hypothetical protein